MKIVVTDEERKAFMKGFHDRKRISDRTDGIKGEGDKKFFAEKLIKMGFNKNGKEEFLVQWVGYPLS